MKMTHLLVRKEGVLCTNCFVTEPVHCGSGTPMDTMLIAFDMLARRHQRCAVLPKESLRKFKAKRAAL